MLSEKTPKGFRIHIGIFGRRNTGKSSLLNAITRQQVSIVSAQAGTTTDPVEKPMELLPLGPVLFIDTAGLDDTGAVGMLRVERTRQVFDRTDLGVIVTDGQWGEYEERILAELQSRKIPVIAVFNKSDIVSPSNDSLKRITEAGIPFVQISTLEKKGILEFRQALLDNAPSDYMSNFPILSDLVGPSEMAILVTPIDKEAPKGRLILPQVQAIRDLLDNDSFSIVVRENQLANALERLKIPPKLVVTDSQAFAEVSKIVPRGIPLTGFSILFARLKGNLAIQTEGAMMVDNLNPGDEILIAEACSHHPIEGDIGREKIPRWLNGYVGASLKYTTVQGHDLPEDLSRFKLVIHCGACMWNRREMQSRIMRCVSTGVPITNYGLVIARSLGMFERALEPFPEALQVYRSLQK